MCLSDWKNNLSSLSNCYFFYCSPHMVILFPTLKEQKLSLFCLIFLYRFCSMIHDFIFLLLFLDRAERHKFWPRRWLFFPLFSSLQKRGKKRMNSKNHDQKSCLSALSYRNNSIVITSDEDPDLLWNWILIHISGELVSISIFI